MPLTAAIAGASGYAGGELLRLIDGHPGLAVGPVSAGGNAGRRLGDLHPHLPALADRVLAPADADALAAADIVFCALPHGQSAELVSRLPAEIPVVDLGADFRLIEPADWGHYYGGAHAGTWVYGLPEIIGREPIAQASRIANPGCYPTAVALAMHPILAAGLIGSGPIVVVAASGTSGAGRSPSDGLLASQVMGSMSAYKVGGAHQHTPEMEQVLSTATDERVTVSFTPMLAPMPRGILATVSAEVAEGVTTEVLRECLHAAYDREPFVHVLPAGSWPQTGATLGSNSTFLQVAADPHAGRIVVVAALDNLVKGAAGQAIQNANLVLGLEENMGLPVDGVAP